MTAPQAVWDVWVDTGGTFTDCLARAPDGVIHRAKILSTSGLRGRIVDIRDVRSFQVQLDTGALGDLAGFTLRSLSAGSEEAAVVSFDPATGSIRLAKPVHAAVGDTFEVLSPEEAPILAARLVTGTPAAATLPAIRMRLATTRGTNALLERTGGGVALFLTRGFSDLLHIGDQSRPDLFALRIERPTPLPAAILEVGGRMSSGGHALEAVDTPSVRQALRRAQELGIRRAVVSLLNAWTNPAHEREVREVLESEGLTAITLSSDIAPSVHYLNRTRTAVADAYLEPVLGEYLDAVDGALREGERVGGRLRVMTSAGGLVSRAAFRPTDSLLSGPAAGIVGAVAAGRAAGFERLITFDMGGTSTDVARFDGDFDYVWRHAVGGVELVAPALAIETVAAGGGSVCTYLTGALAVGPQSAGADPGPACYGAGGPLTITDCNLLLGRLDPAHFGIPVAPEAAEEAARALALEVDPEHVGAAPPTLLHGLIEIANERMADAIRRISIRRGYDPSDYALVSFGGAGGQHVCGIAERLGVQQIVIPPDPALLSARGLGAAAIERVAQRQLLRPLGDDPAWLHAVIEQLEVEARGALAAERVDSDRAAIRSLVDLRIHRQDTAVSVDCPPGTSLRSAFRARYQDIYGYDPETADLEVESIRVIARYEADAGPLAPEPTRASHTRPDRLVWIGGEFRKIPVVSRASLGASTKLNGPALVFDPHTTIVVEAGWSIEANGSGALVIGRRSSKHDYSSSAEQKSVIRSAVREQLVAAAFEALVEEMGEQLRRTAISVNIKERLDFSCGLLDPDGQLVANAPHIPVHLGALGLCVRSVAAAVEMLPGDVVVTNHPAFGGSHLPDVTVITPVHGSRGELAGYVASRAHHAEIGGSRPGSMPPGADDLEEEGVVISPMHLIREGMADWRRIGDLLRNSRYPSRAPVDNLADLRAQIAANRRGAMLLSKLVEANGLAEVARQMDALRERSARLAAGALSELGPATLQAREELDDGTPIQVRIEIDGGRATIDFAGSAPVHPGNLNATPAIVRSAALYVVRLLVRENIPLNEGLLDPVELRIPRGILNPPFDGPPSDCPAVVGGNTEVSQRLVDTLVRAFGLAACSQGTMNNVLFGSDRFGYYETIGGGSGAGRGFRGTDGVHTHMTNTRITDPEILEHRYPIRLLRFELRRDSGGRGRWDGGDGIRREIEFLEPMQLSLLGQHRVVRPFGMKGGEAGAAGRQWIVRQDGAREALAGIDGCDVAKGDRLTIETPGGGGWGRPER